MASSDWAMLLMLRCIQFKYRLSATRIQDKAHFLNVDPVLTDGDGIFV
jgi:hypothetical protein